MTSSVIGVKSKADHKFSKCFLAADFKSALLSGRSLGGAHTNDLNEGGLEKLKWQVLLFFT